MLENVESYKYLGIEFTRKREYKEYKKKIQGKARRKAYLVRAVCRNVRNISMEVLNTLWTALVRPILEYGAEVWGFKKWEGAEKIQKRMGRFILGHRWNSSIDAMKGELEWWSLQERRDLLRMKYWGKIMLMKKERNVR